MAQSYKEWGIYEQSEIYFAKAIALDPNYLAAYHLRALTRYGVGKMRAAIRDTTRGKSISQGNKDILGLRGLCLHNLVKN